jgi:hypothetical protein
VTQGVAYTEAMQAYIIKNQDRLFHSEIAHNLTEMSGIPVTPSGVSRYLHRMRQNGNGNGPSG